MRNIYTDMAKERIELNGTLEGIEENVKNTDSVSISHIEIKTESASKKLEKPIGNYITLDCESLAEVMPERIDVITSLFSKELSSLLNKNEKSVLIVGLGNRFITPDSLGPRCIDKVFITRHLRQYMGEMLEKECPDVPAISALSPGVLGVTGIETMEIIRGVIPNVMPDLIIAIDALASRRASRIGASIQITDTGITPGSGVGNTRKGLNEKDMGVRVIAIGVPLVVYASTIIYDATGKDIRGDESLAELADMIVTLKDIDKLTDNISTVISQGINMALFNKSYDNIKRILF